MLKKIVHKARNFFKKNNRKFQTMKIGHVTIGSKHPTFIIAEMGINHNGSIEIAKKLIDAAADAGVQAVKFQKRTVPVVYTEEELAKPRTVNRGVLENAIKRGVLSKTTISRLQKSDFKESTNGDLKWALEFTKPEYEELFSYAQNKGLLAFASPWDEASVDFLEELNVPAYKVASASITDHGLLKKIKATGKPIILSTGMSTIEEVVAAIKIIGDKDFILMHAVSTYPSNVRDLNLKMIATLREMFPSAFVGYSGHEQGLGTTIAAATLGARAVERHLTLDKKMFGTDQSASLEPHEFKQLVQEIRNMEAAYGDGAKHLLEAEVPIQQKLRRVKSIPPQTKVSIT